MRLDDVPSIQERHLSVRLYPDLIPSMRRNDVQRGDMQPKLARLCELAQAGPEREQVVARDRGGEIGEGFANVVDAAMLDTKDVAIGLCAAL